MRITTITDSVTLWTIHQYNKRHVRAYNMHYYIKMTVQILEVCLMWLHYLWLQKKKSIYFCIMNKYKQACSCNSLWKYEKTLLSVFTIYWLYQINRKSLQRCVEVLNSYCGLKSWPWDDLKKQKKLTLTKIVLITLHPHCLLSNRHTCMQGH